MSGSPSVSGTPTALEMHVVPGGEGWKTACGRPVRGLRLPSDPLPAKSLPVVAGDRWTGPYGAERITCRVCIAWCEREGWL